MFRWTTLPGFLCVTAVIFTCCIQISLCQLNAACSTTPTDNCTVENSFCDPSNQTCLCNDTYYETNESCSPKISLDISCTPPAECKDANAVCDGTCHCNTGYYKSGNECKEKISLDLSCTPPAECKDANAVCDGTCHCKTDYYKSGNECKEKISLDMTCNLPAECKDANAVCDVTCHCKTDYYKSGNECKEKISLDLSCTPPAECKDANAVCDGTCHCKTDYYKSGNECKEKISLDLSCTPPAECKDANAVCDGTCHCKSDYYKSGNECKEKISLDMSCNLPAECRDANAVCDGTCHCKTDYYKSGNECKEKISLDISCTPPAECKDANAVCGGTCHCKTDYYKSGNECKEKITLDMSCNLPAECKDANAVCDGTCHCKTDYYKSGNECKEKISLDSPCTPPAECKDANAVCDGTCHCKTGYYKSGNECKEISNLNVIGLRQISSTLATVTVGWTEPNDKSAITKYTISWTPTTAGSGNIFANVRSTKKQITGLQSGTEYSITVTSVVTHLDQTTSPGAATVRTKTDYNSPCNDSLECFHTYTSCIPNPPRRCLCTEQYIWNGSQCIPVSLLEPQTVNVSEIGTTYLNVEWNISDSYKRFVTRYDIIWSPVSDSDTNITASNTTTNTKITDLTPGELYNVTVRTVVDDEGIEKYAENTAYDKRTTPAKPGPYLDSESNKTAPDITLYFKSSDGIVSTYTVSLIGESDGYNTTKAFIPKNTTNQHVYFTNITAGHYYTLYITAISGTSHSDVYKSNRIRGSVTPPGVVSNLTVTDITYSSMKTSWKKPKNPNGDIYAYIILVNKDDQCIQKTVLRCVDCGNMVVDNDTLCTDVKPAIINKTEDELNNDSVVFSYTIENLDPFTKYTVDVLAFNEVDAGEHSVREHDTLTKRASTPGDFKNLAITSSSIRVTWTPESPRPGITNYNVTVYEKSESGDQDKVIRTDQIAGWSNKYYNAVNLSSYWKYTFTLTAETSAGRSEPVKTGYIRTNESAPNKVETFSVSAINGNYTAVTVRYMCPKQKDGRNGKIIGSKLAYNTSQETPSGIITDDITRDNSKDCTFSFNVPVTPEVNYTFYVYIKNTYAGAVTTNIFYTKPGPPILQTGKIVTKPATPTFETGFSMMVCAKCVYAPTTGRVILAGIIVFREDVYNKQKVRRRRQIESIDTYKTYTNWYKARSNNFKSAYRATKDRWVDTDLKNVEYQIGSMKNCEKDMKAFCNGPVSAGTKYVVIIFACTNGGCQETSDVHFETKAKDEAPIELIVGIIVALTVILVLVIVIVVLLRRRYPKKGPPSDTGSDSEEFINIDKVRPVKMCDFRNRVVELHKDSNLRFSQEYEDLRQVSPNLPMIHSEKNGNRVKNRYVNILPFDHSRVKLLPLDEDMDNGENISDYVNANYIPGYKGPREYIATQGPMTGTIADFWRMIWEQNSTLIVMLSDLQEKGRPKVDQYWPPNAMEPVSYGEITVEMTSVSQLNKFIIRIFKLSLGTEERLVRQYFIPGWEDYSANLSPEDVISFIQTIRKEIHPTADSGPVIVHCSAGVGRSGTFIALDVFQQWVDDHQLDDELDVFDFVLKMRNNRPHMVQTEKQYIFIHDTLNNIIDKRKLILCPPEESVYANDAIYQNKAFEADEENLYQNVTSVKEPNTPTTVL